MGRLTGVATPPSECSSRHSPQPDDDEDKIPEEELMKYTRDSMAPSPIQTPRKDTISDQISEYEYSIQSNM